MPENKLRFPDGYRYGCTAGADDFEKMAPADNGAWVKFSDRRNPCFESRRRSDCFPDGGCVVLTIVAFSFVSFFLGFGLGWWVG